jgi:hypothetical protein
MQSKPRKMLTIRKSKISRISRLRRRRRKKEVR